MDFTQLIAAMSSQASPLNVALAAIAAVIILPGVAKWGYNKVVGWFSTDDGDDDDDEDLDGDEYQRCYYCTGRFPPDELDHQGNGIHVCAECFEYTNIRCVDDVDYSEND